MPARQGPAQDPPPDPGEGAFARLFADQDGEETVEDGAAVADCTLYGPLAEPEAQVPPPPAPGEEPGEEGAPAELQPCRGPPLPAGAERGEPGPTSGAEATAPDVPAADIAPPDTLPVVPAPDVAPDIVSAVGAREAPVAPLAAVRPAAEALVAVMAQLPEGAGLVMELTLDLGEAGPVRLVLEAAGDVIRVQLAARDGAALELLRAHAADLAAGLQAAGYREAQLSFGGWPAAPPPAAPAMTPEAEDAPPPARPVVLRIGPRGGLDIRW